MKHLDGFSRRFLVTCLGLGFLLACASLFLFSVNHTFAQQSGEPPSGLFDVDTGTYQLQFSQEFDGDRTNYRAVVLNTKTAETRYYYYNYARAEWMIHDKQIPTMPF